MLMSWKAVVVIKSEHSVQYILVWGQRTLKKKIIFIVSFF